MCKPWRGGKTMNRLIVYRSLQTTIVSRERARARALRSRYKNHRLPEWNEKHVSQFAVVNAWRVTSFRTFYAAVLHGRFITAYLPCALNIKKNIAIKITIPCIVLQRNQMKSIVCVHLYPLSLYQTLKCITL